MVTLTINHAVHSLTSLLTASCAIHSFIQALVHSFSHWIANAIELNWHTICVRIRGSVVSVSFIFQHPPEEKNKKKSHSCTNALTRSLTRSYLHTGAKIKRTTNQPNSQPKNYPNRNRSKLNPNPKQSPTKQRNRNRPRNRN